LALRAVSSVSVGCKICDDKAACLTIDRYLDQHINYATISRALTLADWPVSAGTVSDHDKHRVKGVNPEIRAGKRDAAIIIKDRVLDALALVPESDGQWIDGADGERHFIPGGSILDKNLQPALNTALKAQALEDKREQKKVVQNFWVQLYTGQQSPALLSDGTMIEGEATEVLYSDGKDTVESEDG
jgi:hypothetical protein